MKEEKNENEFPPLHHRSVIREKCSADETLCGWGEIGLSNLFSFTHFFFKRHTLFAYFYRKK
jgi:hypothetical protein